MRLGIKGTKILHQMLSTDKRFILHVGGSRSSKTHSILQYLIISCFKKEEQVITIARKTFPSLRAGAYREFLQILKDLDLYKTEDHNKTNNTYTLNNNLIQFISIDQSIKLRGLKHDIVFIDECNEVSKDEADQIFMRTNDRIILAQNPSDALHWSMNLMNNDNCLYIHSTYKDNPFLPQGIINQIESYRDTDEDAWNVYGLGLPAKNNELVYSSIKPFISNDLTIKVEDKDFPVYEEIIYGADWGWNHPTAIVKIYLNYTMNKVWAEELIHESYLTMDDLMTKIKGLNIPQDKPIYCDSAEPQRIETLKRAGYDAIPANKDVKSGIDLLKSMEFYLHSNSVKTWDETRKFKWRMKGEMKTDEPIKLFDDGLSAIRYAVYTWVTKTKKTSDYDFDIDIIDF